MIHLRFISNTVKQKFNFHFKNAGFSMNNVLTSQHLQLLLLCFIYMIKPASNCRIFACHKVKMHKKFFKAQNRNDKSTLCDRNWA